MNIIVGGYSGKITWLKSLFIFIITTAISSIICIIIIIIAINITIIVTIIIIFIITFINIISVLLVLV